MKATAKQPGPRIVRSRRKVVYAAHYIPNRCVTRMAVEAALARNDAQEAMNSGDRILARARLNRAEQLERQIVAMECEVAA